VSDDLAKGSDARNGTRVLWKVARIGSLVTLLCVPRAAVAADTFVVDSKATRVSIHVGKTGLGSFAAGHEHDAVANTVTGQVVADFDDLSQSSVDVSVDASSLKIVDRDESPEDVQKVQQTMVGPQVLDVTRFPRIRFRSKAVTGTRVLSGTYVAAVSGELSLHGVTKPFTVPLQLESREDALTATGKMTVKQTDFGIEPISAGGGLVKVEDDVTISFQIVARSRPR
jgi:polyisoprenoid-binding protein YceI